MKPIRTKVGPLAAASATAIATSQSVKSGKNVVLNGTLAIGFSANILALSQSLGAAGNLTLNGAQVSAGVGFLIPAEPVIITSAGDDSGTTFTITGITALGYGGIVETITGANVGTSATAGSFWKINSITASAATAAAVTAGVNASAAVLDLPRRLIITSAGNDSGITFTIFGTDWNGSVVSETLTGGNAAAVQSTYDYATVTGIIANGATASTITVGTNGVASTRPIALDSYAMYPTSVQCDVTGTVNYTVQLTMDNPNDLGWSNVNWVNSSDAAVVNATGTAFSGFVNAPVMTRLLLNSGTGSVALTVAQSSSVEG